MKGQEGNGRETGNEENSEKSSLCMIYMIEIAVTAKEIAKETCFPPPGEIAPLKSDLVLSFWWTPYVLDYNNEDKATHGGFFAQIRVIKFPGGITSVCLCSLLQQN